MSQEKPFLSGPMLPSVRANVAGRVKPKIGELADEAYESLDDIKARIVLAVGELKNAALGPANDLPD